MAPLANKLSTSLFPIGMIRQRVVTLESISATNSIIIFFPPQRTELLTPLLTCFPPLFSSLSLGRKVLNAISLSPFYFLDKLFQVQLLFFFCFFGQSILSQVLFSLCLFEQVILSQNSLFSLLLPDKNPNPTSFLQNILRQCYFCVANSLRFVKYFPRNIHFPSQPQILSDSYKFFFLTVFFFVLVAKPLQFLRNILRQFHFVS